ncbi:FG-GAP repeat domain-containing protein [Streptomyces sp. NPDC049040]|uniref:FG-GAP repeat domain-containing protein n=1 Tax=Streptomyces sp. NPDC049040 TaxID=3365593 RepID=UPI0037114BEC
MSAPSSAAADTPPPAAGISVGDAQIDLYGDPGSLDLTVAEPTATDAYIRLEFSGGANRLRITDDAGTVLPIAISAGENPTLTVGTEDSDHNGIPGAPLPAGTTHLHVSAQAPISSPIYVSARVLNGSDGAMIAHSGPYAGGEILVSEPKVATTWFTPDGDPMPTAWPPAIATGNTRAVTVMVATQDGLSVAGGTATRLTLHAGTVAAAGYTVEELASGLHIGYSPNATSYASTPWTLNPDGSLSVQVPLRHWIRNGTSTEFFQVTADWGLPAGRLPIHFQTIGGDGRPYAESTTAVDLTADSIPAGQRATLYGRDSTGALWQHQATPIASRPGTFAPRTRVGGGWGVYNTITALGPLKANGTGDLVARDSAGVLWYYRGTGNSKAPFATRTRIGGGWNIYDQIVGAGDVTGDGHPDLVARDSAGVLWLYRGTGHPAAPLANRIRICGGWQGYNQLIAAGDITGDGHPDLLARDTAGVLWYYPGTGNAAAPYANRVRIGGGWQGYTSIVGIGDMTGKGHQDLVARDTAGKFWYYRGTRNPAAPYATRTLVGGGMNIYNTLL